MRACTLGYVSSAYGGLTAAVVLTVYGAAASKLRVVTPCKANGCVCVGAYSQRAEGIADVSMSEQQGKQMHVCSNA